MDVGAVEQTLGEAVARARAGEGPSLVEAKTYRFAGHSRADTAPYRPEGELDEWRKRDPLLVTREGLIASGAATAADLDAVEARVRQELSEVVAEVEALPAPGFDAMFANIVAKAGASA
jgi:pyruvate dehydrogenase E1 component alpha subunit